MNRAIVVTEKKEIKLYSSLKKACEAHGLNYHTVGKHLRDYTYWSNDLLTVKRKLVQ